MDKWYIIISGLLLLLAAVLFIRLIQYKRQMRIFAAKLQKRLHGGVDQEIHVEYFDRDIVALAKALNDYSDQIKERNRALEQYEWIQESGIQAAFDIPESVVWVQSNEKVLNRIFTNFFSNARKYADTRISVCLQQDADGVSITFTNDIEADNEIDIDHVFDAFYRGNSRREEGAGLGLYVVKCLTDKLGHVVSAEVKDKQFSVMLRIK